MKGPNERSESRLQQSSPMELTNEIRIKMKRSFDSALAVIRVTVELVELGHESYSACSIGIARSLDLCDSASFLGLDIHWSIFPMPWHDTTAIVQGNCSRI